jgi:hypothetical protein
MVLVCFLVLVLFVYLDYLCGFECQNASNDDEGQRGWARNRKVAWDQRTAQSRHDFGL